MELLCQKKPDNFTKSKNPTQLQNAVLTTKTITCGRHNLNMFAIPLKISQDQFMLVCFGLVKKCKKCQLTGCQVAKLRRERLNEFEMKCFVPLFLDEHENLNCA